MFDSIRRNRRRKSMSRRSSRIRQRRQRRIDFVPILKIAGLVAAVAGLACLIIFLIVPWIKGDMVGKTEPTPTPQTTVQNTPEPTPIASEDMSAGAFILEIEYKSINDPFVYGNEVVFATGNRLESAPDVDTLAVFDITTKTTTEMPGIELKYSSLFEPKMNDKYIVYLDCKSQYGGNVCGYDRETGEMFVMREYLYGKPKVSLAGEYAVWMQETGQARDILYLYHLPTGESTAIEEFKNTPLSVSAAHMSQDALVYVQPEGENYVLDGSSASTNAEIVVMPLAEGGDKQLVTFLPGTFVYNLKITGDYIVYLDSTGDYDSQLMYCKKNGDTYTLPEVIADGILNYDVGDGFTVYTKDNSIYIYYFEDGSTGRISDKNLRCMLGSANGKGVVWYDFTDGFDSGVNVVQYTTVP